MKNNNLNYKLISQFGDLHKLGQHTEINLPFDFSESVEISSLALLKMLKHGKAGIPIEVMGLMVGKYTNDISCIIVNDVFAMPQTGTGVSVEAIDPAFQTKMLDMFRQVGAIDNIVGWYHSHPGFGCWLSVVDINTQQSFEQLNPRSIAVVIDPIQSIKGKIIIEAFRLFPAYSRGFEIREISCIQGIIYNRGVSKDDHGLNKYYYSLNVSFRVQVIEKNTFSYFYEKIWIGQVLHQKKKKIDSGIKYIKLIKEMVTIAKKISSTELIVSLNCISLNSSKKKDLIKNLKKNISQIIDEILKSCLKRLIFKVCLKY